MTTNVPLGIYLTAWRFYRRYFRYEVHGFEHLVGGRSSLVVGYHGRPFAWDLLILLVEVYERVGYLPHGVIHDVVLTNPLTRWLSDGLGMVTGDGPAIAGAVERGEHVVVLPGGTREAARSFRTRYRVDWGPRTGYLKLALKYGMPIIPVGASGVDDAYVGLNDGYALGKRIHMPAKIPFWVGVGPTGPWPLSQPWPVKIRQHVGEPIELEADGPVDPRDRDAMQRLHRRVMGSVQAQIDAARVAR